MSSISLKERTSKLADTKSVYEQNLTSKALFIHNAYVMRLEESIIFLTSATDGHEGLSRSFENQFFLQS